jgi:glyoxalase family protein
MAAMTIQGLHHITLVCADAQRTVNFYVQVLGLRFVKRTVNFDDRGSYHLYFGDEAGRPGTAITFFEWPGARKGQWGIGGTHHFALAVHDEAGLLKWKRRLTDLGLAVDGPLNRHYCKSIYFNDPDGAILEIATMGPGWAMDEAALPVTAATWPEPVPTITADMALHQGMHHITAISSDLGRTHAFFGELLGLPRMKTPALATSADTGVTSDFDDPKSAHWYWGVGDGRPGTLVTYFEHNPDKARRAQMGAGQTHHFALAVPDEATQLEWREKLVRAMLRVSPVRDRVYFKSIYTNDPDGHIVELATAGPGFAVDEPLAELGQSLRLPPWLASQRSEIESALRPLRVPEWHKLA